ncbi:MAG: 2,3-diphosphoglycerate-dependent phosphoglycerate mutase [Epsilonproteobacteria bacterium]|nr:2,3-diphosphoglycerate-dependent phosphoglycerate mutase [Campylobacterota bacterium]NPA89517.1 2,3-diphosphoglycerate-dependent phosphoglycerate mutase [Campylobacterota bacterium]
MGILVMVRHGKSVWNKENRFTGWVDVDLSEEGIEEAKRAGNILKKSGIRFDVCYSSYLKRAIKTGIIILRELDQLYLPHLKDWRFNERHYGALTGENKAEAKARLGEEKFLLYRRSYDVPPPPLDENSPYHPKNDPKYAHLPPELLPSSESLKDNQRRAMEAFYSQIAPRLVEGENVLLTAHGNTIRGMVKALEGISDEDIVKFEVATGVPRVYEFDNNLQILNIKTLD